MQVDHFREQVRFYCHLLDKTQQDLAKAIGQVPSMLSHKLYAPRDRSVKTDHLHRTQEKQPFFA